LISQSPAVFQRRWSLTPAAFLRPSWSRRRWLTSWMRRLAFCSTLMPVKVLSKQGFGSLTGVAEGIRYAADNGAQVINMSLGGPVKSRILEDAVNHALSKGVVVVAAAGNSGWPGMTGPSGSGAAYCPKTSGRC